MAGMQNLDYPKKPWNKSQKMPGHIPKNPDT